MREDGKLLTPCKLFWQENVLISLTHIFGTLLSEDTELCEF